MTLAVGDKVRITGSRSATDVARKFKGLEAEVVTLKRDECLLKPLSPRPDGWGSGQFYWTSHYLEKIEDEPPRPLGLRAGDKVVNLKTGREGLVLKGPVSGELKVYDQEPPIRDAVPAQALEEYEFHHPGTYDVWRRVTVPATAQAQPW